MLAVGPTAFADDPVPPDPEDLPEPPALPEVPPDAVLIQEFSVHSQSETGVDSAPLAVGETYLVEASGLVEYGLGTADPECSNFGASDPVFQRERFPTDPHTADLLIDKTGLEWVAQAADAANCNTTDHEYRTFLVPEATKPYNFVLKDGGWRGDNSGAFTVRIYRVEAVAPTGTLVNQFSFPAAAPNGGTSGVVLATNRSYRIQAAGQFFYTPTARHDAECAYLRNDQPGDPTSPGIRQDEIDTVAETPDVLIDRQQVKWVSSTGKTCDDETHTYIFEQNGTGGPVNLRVRDTWHGDNAGLVTVHIYDLGPATEGGDGAGGGQVPSAQDPRAVLTSAGAGAVFVEEVTVDARSETPVSTTTPLAAGQIYVFESSGVVRFGSGQADAECANFDLLPTFKREYFTSEPHTADLLVNGIGREWTALVPDVQGCNTTDHTYRTFMVPASSDRATFLFNDGGWRGDNSGQFKVRVFVTDEVPPAGTQTDHFGFDASDADGVTSTAVLDPNTSYRIVAAGFYRFTDSEARSDPECVYPNQAGTGLRGEVRETGVDASLGNPDVMINQDEVSWIPTTGRSGCDERTHTYMVETAGLSGPVNLRVRDTWHGDNGGLVEVKIFSLGPASGLQPSPVPFEPPRSGLEPPDPDDADTSLIPVGEFTVDSRSDTGTDSNVPLTAGEKYVIQADGAVFFGSGNADAECANFAPLQPLYKREWFTAAPHTADLLIDGAGVEWVAANPDAEGCDSTNHVYTLSFVPEATKRYNFRFNDAGYRGDNSGSLRVRIFLTDRLGDEGTRIDQFGFSAADSDGANSSVALATDHTYRIKIAGDFSFGDARSRHDAECVRVAGAPGDRQNVIDENSTTPDVIINGGEVDWIASQGRTGCDDTSHTYVYAIAGHSGGVNLRVRDSWHGDNSGLLEVQVFDLGAA